MTIYTNSHVSYVCTYGDADDGGGGALLTAMNIVAMLIAMMEAATATTLHNTRDGYEC